MHFQLDDITLELLDHHHAAELFQLTDHNRAYLRQWLPWLDRIQVEADTKNFIELSKKQQAQNNGFQLAIKHEERLVGMIGLHYINWKSKKTSIGYWIAENAQGQGIVVRSCQELIDYCLNVLGLSTIEISCAVQNHKSQAIPKRLGFKQLRMAKKAEDLYGVMVDHYVYVLEKANL